MLNLRINEYYPCVKSICKKIYVQTTRKEFVHKNISQGFNKVRRCKN